MKPLDFYFSAKHSDEKILFVVHRHWFNMLTQYIPIFGLLILMIISVIVYPYIFDDFTGSGGKMLFYFIQTFFLILIWIYGFVIWFDYYLDIWIITTTRIVNVEQKGLFSRQVSELKYTHIQDVSTDVKGIFPTLLNYGDVTVQTAAEQSHFIFRSIGNPYKVKSDIMTQTKKNTSKQPL